MKKIQEKALKIVYSDYDSDYHELMERFGTHTMLQSRLRNIIIEVFKSLKHINPVYIQDMFELKDQPYSLRNPFLLIQTKKETTNSGLRTFSYLGSKLWNELPVHFKDLTDIDINEFKSRLRHWSGPNCDAWEMPFV